MEVDGGEGDDWLVELGQGEAAAGEEEPEATNDQIEEAEGDDSFFDSEGDAAGLCLEQPLQAMKGDGAAVEKPGEDQQRCGETR